MTDNTLLPCAANIANKIWTECISFGRDGKPFSFDYAMATKLISDYATRPVPEDGDSLMIAYMMGFDAGKNTSVAPKDKEPE